MTENQELQSSLYALGALSRKERLLFEQEIDANKDLRELARGLCDTAAAYALSSLDRKLTPPPSLAGAILDQLVELPYDILRAFHLKDGEGFVLTGPDGLIEWVNSDFMEMCGYSMKQLRGRKPGHILQGPETDPATVEKIRDAVRHDRPVNTVIRNYHKNGTPYWVSLSISPVFDLAKNPRAYVAIERELAGPVAA